MSWRGRTIVRDDVYEFEAILYFYKPNTANIGNLRMFCYNKYSNTTEKTASPIHRLRRTKAALLAVSLTLAGVLILMGDTWLG